MAVHRVGRRISHEDFAHQRVREPAHVLPRSLLVEGPDLPHQMLQLDQGSDQQARTMADGASARSGRRRPDPEWQAGQA